MEERRAAPRYNLTLPVEIWLAPNLSAVGSISAKTRDISTHGFYFDIAEEFTVGAKFEFSIALPNEVTGATRACARGKARVVRVEETGESHLGLLGVGAFIESHQISRAEAVNP